MTYGLYATLAAAAERAIASATRFARFQHHRERLGAYPEDLRERVRGHRVLWVHSASVGELLASRPLLARFREALGDWRIVLSTTSIAGREIAAGFPEASVAVLLPFDSPAAVERSLDALTPSLFVFTETEIWPNLLRALAARRVPAILLSGRVSQRSFRRYLWVRSLLRQALGHVARFGMQSEDDATRIRALGAPPERVRVTGSLKSEAPAASSAAISFDLPGPLWIAASTHAGEEQACARVHARLRSRFSDLRLLLAPRHLDRLPEVEAALRRESLSYVRRTDLLEGCWRGERDVLLLDTLGELGGLYRGAAAVFVGGSLAPIGGHNLLEPARAAVPVLFGPHVESVRSVARALEEGGGGAAVRDEIELEQRLAGLLSDAAARRRMATAAGRAAVSTGALEASFQMAAEFFL